jgi:ligand-binding sensor protein/anti-anti-sigma regulatory factor
MNSSSNIVNLSQSTAEIELENLTFADLFNVEEIQAIQDSFALATGVASIITDPEGQPITRASNFCRLCSEIIRGTPTGLANCMKSDAAIGRPNPSGPIIQPCLSGGLIDAGASIMVGDRHIANWLIGQVLDGEPDEASMLAYAEQIGANKEDFRAALKQVTWMSREQFNQISQALFLIAQQMSKLAIQNLQQNRYLAQYQQAEAERERLQQEIIEAQQQAIAELSTPVIPIMDRIIVMPLIGSIDSLRARDVTRTLLAGINQHRAKIVILDVTGVSIMDTGVVNHLNKTIQAARLKGARAIVTGLSDSVAEAIVDLGIDWSNITTMSDLQTGLVAALNSLGVKLTNENKL